MVVRLHCTAGGAAATGADEEAAIGGSAIGLRRWRSNGVAERGIQEIEGKLRAVFLGFLERIGRRVDARERVVSFIPEYAA